MLDSAGRVIVIGLHPGHRRCRTLGVGRPILQLLSHRGATVAGEKVGEALAVKVRWIDLGQTARIPPFPMADKVRVKPAGPSDPALQEGEFERGKAPRHTAQEQRLAYR